MDRNRRRELKHSKWLRRVKGIYQSHNGCWYYREDDRVEKCNSTTEFIEKLKFVQLFKNTGTPYGYNIYDHLDRRRKNRRSRKLAKVQINEGILEWFNMEE